MKRLGAVVGKLTGRHLLLAQAIAIVLAVSQPGFAAAQALPSDEFLAPADFVIDDQVVSDPDEMSLVDMEFNQRDGLFAWQDDQDNLWVAQVDPVTGDFMPRNGKGELVATGLVPIKETANGPEWIDTEDGMEIVFSLQGFTRQVGHAWRTNAGWTYESIRRGRFRYNPYGSKDENDPAPRILYWFETREGRLAYWRELDDPSTEQRISDDSIVFPSWVDGARAILVTANFGGFKQCSWHDIDTGVKTQISTDPEDKRFGKAWRAPEYGDGWVAMCANSSGSRLGIYLRSGSTWQNIGFIYPPSGNALYSVEYFVYGGRSYITMLTTVGEKNNDVWVVGIDFSNLIQRRVNPDVAMDRRDPEVFITAKGPYVYYMERTGRALGIIHRASTGLGPLQ